MSEIRNLQPKAVWENFHLLTQVPRPSGHLEKVQQFLLDWAKERGIEAFQDTAGNIIMRKPATPGYEDRKVVTLQAHMDMVPQKAKDAAHNFETDPIQTWIDGEWVKAKDTTLGADDGMGVATIMGLMEADDLQHGPLEGFITADEESTMGGVNDMKPGTLTGDILMNLDNETEGEFLIGSAGGINMNATAEYAVENNPCEAAVLISLHGLLGGHSGLEINEGRANANKLMARVVRAAMQQYGARLATWEGGNMRNAIPRTAEVVLALAAADVDRLLADVAVWQDTFRAEYYGVDDALQLEAAPTDKPGEVLPEGEQKRLLDALTSCHNGVLRFIPTIPTIVETSSNLAIIRVGGGKTYVQILIRSSQRSMRLYCEEVLAAAFEAAGMRVETGGAYTEWQPSPKSEIVDLMCVEYEKLFGVKPTVTVIHAGLECSIIGAMYPHMDIVSFGPTLRSPHTPNERCHIPSVAKYWELVKAALVAVPKK